jgi:hypothetical protein
MGQDQSDGNAPISGSKVDGGCKRPLLFYFLQEHANCYYSLVPRVRMLKIYPSFLTLIDGVLAICCKIRVNFA